MWWPKREKEGVVVRDERQERERGVVERDERRERERVW